MAHSDLAAQIMARSVIIIVWVDVLFPMIQALVIPAVTLKFKEFARKPVPMECLNSKVVNV
jgi:hypothetical protein